MTSAAFVAGASGISCVFEDPADSTIRSAESTSNTGTTLEPVPSPTASGLQVAPAPAPSPGLRETEIGRLAPFAFADVQTSGNGANFGGGSAELTGELEAHIDIDAENQAGYSGTIYAFVAWNYTYDGEQPLKATVAVDYTFSPGIIDAYGVCAATNAQALESNAKAYVQIGAKVLDTTSGDYVNLILEELGHNNPSCITYDFGGQYKGQHQPVTFQPGHSYRIDAYVVASAYLWPDGHSRAQVTAKIRGIRLVSTEPPWIRTRFISVSEPDPDTWDIYEKALARQGREYYVGVGLLEISAGGNFDWGYVDVQTMYPKSEILGLIGSNLNIALNYNGAPNCAQIILGSAASLPLQGKTWRLLVAYDPHYQNPWDALVTPDVGVPTMPLFAPILGMWAETSLAADKLVSAQRENPSYRLAGLRTAADGVQEVQGTEFFDLANYSLVLPVSRFLALSQPATTSLPEGTRRLPVTVYMPASTSLPLLKSRLLAVQTTSALPSGLEGWSLATEPVVIVSLLHLWEQYMDMPHLLLQSQGLDWVANPHFIELLTQVGQSAEAYREFLSGLCWMPRSGGPAIPLTDLPQYVEQQVREVSPDCPLWLAVAGATVAVAVCLSPRLRRWARRIFTVDQARLWLEANRPAQEQTMSAVGHVSNDFGQATSSANVKNRVFFDYVPQRYNQGGAPPDLP